MPKTFSEVYKPLTESKYELEVSSESHFGKTGHAKNVNDFVAKAKSAGLTTHIKKMRHDTGTDTAALVHLSHTDKDRVHSFLNKHYYKGTAKDFEQHKINEVYRPKSPDEQRFVDKHVVVKHADRNGNGDDLFNAKKIKAIKRSKEGHGYETGEDAKVYEDSDVYRPVNYQRDRLNKKIAAKAGKKLSKDSDTGTPDHFTAASRRKRGLSEDQIVEISQKMARAYRDKAGESKEIAQDERRYYKAHGDNTNHETNVIKKRTKGINLATSKIFGTSKVKVKEDLETIENSLLEYFDELGQEVSYEELQELAVGLQEEILDELSDNTIKSYIKKAGRNAANHDDSAETLMDRSKFGGKSNRKMFRDGAIKHAIKSVKRTNGIIKAANKLTKEEILDELSKPLLGRYIKKAVDKHSDASVDSEISYSQDDDKNGEYAEKIANRRKAGISKAVNKLTKENLDNIINRYNKEEISLEEALVEKIAHLSEKHQNLIITLYDSLSEDNQELLFHTLDDQDGINETIDFALEAQILEGKSYEVEAEHTDSSVKTRSYFAKSAADAKSQFHAKHSKDEYKVNSVKKLKEEAKDQVAHDVKNFKG